METQRSDHRETLDPSFHLCAISNLVCSTIQSAIYSMAIIYIFSVWVSFGIFSKKEMRISRQSKFADGFEPSLCGFGPPTKLTENIILNVLVEIDKT